MLPLVSTGLSNKVLAVIVVRDVFCFVGGFRTHRIILSIKRSPLSTNLINELPWRHCLYGSGLALNIHITISFLQTCLPTTVLETSRHTVISDAICKELL